MAADNPHQGRRPYRLIEQTEVDLASLTMQEREQIALMGGLFPERGNDFRGLVHVADIACGTGYWAVSVAREYPQLNVTGITGQDQLIEYAESLATAQGIENVHFMLHKGGEKLTLPFPDNSLDLLRLQYLYTWLYAREWPGFMRECWQIVRPGGYFHLAEPDWEVIVSPAFLRVRQLFFQALEKVGHGQAGGNSEGSLESRLIRHCANAGWEQITAQSYSFPYGTGNNLPQDQALRVELMARAFRPLILAQGVASAEELTEVIQQMKEEMEQGTFQVNRIWVVVCARKMAH